MADNQYIHDNPYLTPYFKIFLDGRPLSDYEHNLVEEVTYEDTSTGSDLVSITIHDPDYAIIGDSRIIKNSRCLVYGGWTTHYKTWIDGYVSAVDVDYPEEGYPTITMHIMDKTYIMNKIERKKVYKNMSYKEIAAKVASLYGLKINIDSTPLSTEKHESVTQSFETDIQFLSSLADEIGFLVFYNSDDNSLNFKDKEGYFSSSPNALLWYRRHPFDILSFRPRIVQADQLDELEESDIDDKDKTTTTAVIKKTTTTASTSSTTTNKGGGGGGGGDITHET